MPKSKGTKHLSFGALLEVAMSKKCTLFWREAHFEVKMHKADHSQTTLIRRCLPEVSSRLNWNVRSPSGQQRDGLLLWPASARWLTAAPVTSIKKNKHRGLKLWLHVSFLSKGMIGPFFSYQQMRHLYYFRKCHWLHGFTWFYHHVFLVRRWFTVNIAIQRGYSLWTKIMNSLRPNVASDKVRMAIERDQASIHWWGGLCYPSEIKHGNRKPPN